VLVGVSPDSNAVRVRANTVTLQFDEVVSERAGGGNNRAGSGSGGLEGLILLSPGDGRERVRWRRSALEIEPGGGLRPNTTYRLTLLPGLGDLRGNAVREAQDLVFSTGDSLDAGEIAGAVFDWAAGRTAVRARVEAFRTADTTFRWRAVSDSSGRYALTNLAAGEYHVRAWIDESPNRLLDARESFDTLTIAVGANATNDFYVFSHDTIGVRVESVEPVDSTALRIRFDRAVSTRWIPDSTSATLMDADSARVAVGVLVPASVFDSTLRVLRAAADSARADSVRADTTGEDTLPRGVPPRAPAPAPVPAAAADTTGTIARGPTFARPLPVREWVLPLPTPLAPGEYRVTVRQAESLAGVRRDSERVVRIRERATPPADTTAAPARRPPPP